MFIHVYVLVECMISYIYSFNQVIDSEKVRIDFSLRDSQAQLDEILWLHIVMAKLILQAF